MINLIAVIFGQCGPLIVFTLATARLFNLTQRTICKKFLNIKLYSISFITNIISNLIKNSVLVKLYLKRNNPQITKARYFINCFKSKAQNNNILLNFALMLILQAFFYNFKFNIKHLIKLSMLVGISEAIRSLSVNILYSIDLIVKIFSKKLNIIKLNLSFLYFFIFQLFSFARLDNNIRFFSSTLISYTGDISNTNSKKNQNDPDALSIHSKRFVEWLSGLIDGDGCFLLSKKGYASLEITMDIRDQHCLYLVKQRYGGAIKIRAGANHLRYRLHNYQGLLKLLNDVNGLIRNPTRILQMERILSLYKITFLQPKPLTYNNGWLSGIFDSDGSIYLNGNSGQIFISISQKDLYILEPLVALYGGKIYPHGKVNAFKYSIYRKTEILSLIKNYFSKYPSRTDRISRLSLVSDFYRLRNFHAHNSSPLSAQGKAWHYFLVKWNKYIRPKEK